MTTLWGFTGGSDGANPFGSLIADENTGALYGTTSGGGASGNGTVFKIDTVDQTLTTIYSFLGSPDGAGPDLGALLIDDKGALYGTTPGGGAHGNGTVFKLTPPGHGQTSWTLSTLYAFTGGNDGSSPQSTLIADAAGSLYGTTNLGGAINTPTCTFVNGCGVVFKLIAGEHGQAPWTEIVLWTFSGGTDGSSPVAGLIADNRGALYGTTVLGGNVNPQGPCGHDGCGVVFQLTGTGFATEDDD